MSWLKGLSTGVVKHWEHACQPVSMRLQGRRDSEHENGYISFILDSLATPFCRDVCNSMNYIMVKGFADWSSRSMATRMPTDSNAAVHREQRYDIRETSLEYDQN